TQARTVQVTEKNKEGACSRINNKKRKADELEEREENRKMLKVKEETSQNASVKINKSYENSMLQQMEQMNMDDITNGTNPWATPSTNETSIEYTNTKNSILHNNQEGTQLGIE
ncbi:44387_t:CDS:2, partial [Gigaspora margarita]